MKWTPKLRQSRMFPNNLPSYAKILPALETEKQRLADEKQQLATTLENETKDSDADGIPDKLDKCPTTATGVTVD